MRILVVEDDPKVAASLQQGLEEAHLDTDVAGTVGLAAECVRSTQYDLMVLDLGLPDGDGLDVLRMVREERQKMAVLILTARDRLDDRVGGLDGGADDYLVKPFAFSELLARIRALLRRVGSGDSLKLSVADLEIDVVARRVHRAGRRIDLRPREFELLEYLARCQGQLVTRDALARHVWNVRVRGTPMDNVIDVHISHLRDKIDREFDPKLLHTLRGEGFVFGVQE